MILANPTVIFTDSEQNFSSDLESTLCFVLGNIVLDRMVLTPLSIIFQLYHGDSSHYSCLAWVSLVQGWGSEVSCPSTLLYCAIYWGNMEGFSAVLPDCHIHLF